MKAKRRKKTKSEVSKLNGFTIYGALVIVRKVKGIIASLQGPKS